MVGFTGSRSLAAHYQSLVSQVVGSFAARSVPLVVGCAAGADQFVRLAAPQARVFYASGYGTGRASFARRSMAMVQAVAASGPGGQLIGFVSAPCPAGLRIQSATPTRAFAGFGSGSWATLSYAASLGLPISVYWCGPGPAPVMPVSWGQWLIPVGIGSAHQPCVLLPAGVQASFL